MPKIKTDEEIRTVFMPKIKAFTDERLTSENAKQIYDFLKPYHYDTDGRRLYEAAKGLLNADIYSEYPAAYTDFFDSLDGYTQLKWLETAKFADKNNERLWSNREFMPSQHDIDVNSPKYKDYQDKLYAGAIRSIIISLMDKQPYLLEGFWNRLSYIENILCKGFPTRDDLNDKIDRELAALPDAEEKAEERQYSEYSMKKAFRDILYNTPMTDELVQALWVTDNVLDDIYKSYDIKNRAIEFYDAVFDYVNKAEHEYLAERVYDRVTLEYEDYKDEVKTWPPEKIIDEAYKLTIFADIQMSLDPETPNFDTEQLYALMSISSPLWGIYHEWQDRDVSHMDDLTDTIRDTADERARENAENDYEIDSDPFGLNEEAEGGYEP